MDSTIEIYAIPLMSARRLNLKNFFRICLIAATEFRSSFVKLKKSSAMGLYLKDDLQLGQTRRGVRTAARKGQGAGRSSQMFTYKVQNYFSLFTALSGFNGCIILN